MDFLSPKGRRGLAIGVCLALVLMVWFVFGQTLTFDFINCDDNIFVYENPIVLNGVTGEGVVRTLTQIGDTFYYPLTVLSFMVDSELYGMNPAGFHLTNVVLHSLSVVLLFLLLRRMTGSLWGSAFLAAIFAIHPIQVEAVAWVTGRKDMLSGVFFLLTVHAYFRYVGKVESRRAKVEGGGTEIGNRKSEILSYGLVFVLFAAGLMAKPMLVTLPCVLLLLDYWPLGRLRSSGRTEDRGRWTEGCVAGILPARASEGECLTAKEHGERKKDTHIPPLPSHLQRYFFVVEKIPFFLLSAVFCVIPFFAGSRLSGGSPVQQPEWSWRIGNALVSYATYLRQMVWPTGLAMPYPETPHSILSVIASAFLLIAITMVVVRGTVKKVFPIASNVPHSTFHKSLLVGWLWFVGMLLPVSGALRFLGVARADRFVYLPMIGILILIGGVLTAMTRRKEGDSCPLNTRKERERGDGDLLSLERRDHESREFTRRMKWRFFSRKYSVLNCSFITIFYRKLCFRFAPTRGRADFFPIFGTLIILLFATVAFVQTGYWRNNLTLWTRSLESTDGSTMAYINLGAVLYEEGEIAAAEACFFQALEIDPQDQQALYNLGVVLLDRGKVEEGKARLREVLALNPDRFDANKSLGAILLLQGDFEEGIEHTRRALHVRPEDVGTQRNLEAGQRLLQERISGDAED